MNIEITDQLIIVHFQGEIDCVNAPVYRQQLSDLLEETNEDVVLILKAHLLLIVQELVWF